MTNIFKRFIKSILILMSIIIFVFIISVPMLLIIAPLLYILKGKDYEETLSSSFILIDIILDSELLKES